VAFQYNVLPQRFMVESRDVIGWTNEEDYSLISYNLAENYRMGFAQADTPAVNDTIILNSVIYPGIFSVAVEVVKRQYLAALQRYREEYKFVYWRSCVMYSCVSVSPQA